MKKLKGWILMLLISLSLFGMTACSGGGINFYEQITPEQAKTIMDTESLLRQLTDNFDELISWAQLYEEATLEKKKMVVNALINRIEMFRDYKVEIDFNFDFEQFTNGLDHAA